MTGETTVPTKFPAALAGVTVAPKALSGAEFTSLAETEPACASVLPSLPVQIQIE